MHSLTTLIRRAALAGATLGLATLLAAPAAAQERMPDIPPPGGERKQDAPPEEGDPLPVPPVDEEEWDGAGGEAPAERGALRRRRPRLRVLPRGADLRLEFDFALLGSSIGGDGHDAQNLDYDDLFSSGSGIMLRAALPMRFHRTAARVSLIAGPFLIMEASEFDGSKHQFANNDEIIPEDMTVSRIGFGGFFRADFGRFFIEPWFSVGAGHVSETDATFDQTFNGGGITTIELYERSNIGYVMGGVRGGVTFWPAPSFALTVFGELSIWGSGAPDAGAVSPLGDSKPGAMAGFRATFGMTVAFGLGDFQGARTARSMRGGDPPPARRPVRDF
jgi:hypothetical protein